MLTILLVIQAIIAVAMVILILIQRSSSDGLAGLSGSSGGNSLLSGRASANILTKTTTILATLFMLNSLAMATITARQGKSTNDIFEQAPAIPVPATTNEATPAQPGATPTVPAETDGSASTPAAPAEPAEPATPVVPKAE